MGRRNVRRRELNTGPRVERMNNANSIDPKLKIRFLSQERERGDRERREKVSGRGNGRQGSGRVDSSRIKEKSDHRSMTMRYPDSASYRPGIPSLVPFGCQK